MGRVGRWVGEWKTEVYSTVGKGLERCLRGFNIFGFRFLVFDDFDGLMVCCCLFIEFWFVFEFLS